MIKDNWLLSYATIDGISRVLKGMNKRTKYKSNMEFATEELKENYTLFENEFRSFFEELMAFSNNKIQEINLKL